jgi:phage-related protein
MLAQAGSAYIPIRPDLTGFHKTIERELQKALGPIVARLAKQIGADLRDGIGQGLGDPLNDPLEESTKKQRPKAPKRGEELGGAFAGAFKRRVTDALKSLPKVELDADSSDADRKVAELRGRLEELSKKTIGIDIDAAAALTELNAIKIELGKVGENAKIDVRADTAAAIRQLEAVQATADKLSGETANIQVDADTARADAELAATDSEVKRLDGRTARVDVDASGAISSLARLAGAVGGIAPLFLGLGGAGTAALLSLAAPAAAAGAGIGGLALVAVPAINRIKDALDAQTKAQQNSAQTALQAQQRALAQAGAQQQLAAAVRSAAVAHQQATAQVRSAEQQLATAQQTAANSQRELTQARLDARRALEDMRNQLVDTGLAVQQSQLDIDRARASLDQARTAAAAAAQNVATAQTALAQAQAAQRALAGDSTATDAAKAQAAANANAAQAALKAAQDQKRARDLDERAAQLAYAQAIQRLKEQQAQLKRLQQDERAASKAGVDGSQAVLAARQRLAAANQQITNSERALAAARANVARTDQNSRDQIAAAQRSVTQASLQGAAANATLTQSMAALSPAALGLMSAWQRLTGAFNVWQRSLEPTVLPVIARGLGLVQSLLPLLTPLVRGAAAAMTSLLTSAQRTFSSPVWQTFATTLGQLTQSTITTLGNVALQVATTVVRIVNAFAPFAPVVLGVVTQIGNLIGQIGGQLAGLAPALAPLIGVIGQLAVALGPLITSALQGLAPVLAGLAPILSTVISVLQPVIAALITGLRPILAALVPVIGLVVGALGRILLALAPVLPVLGQFIAALVNGLMPIITPILTLISQMAAQLAGALITALRAALPSVQQIVLAIAQLLPALMPLVPLMVQWEMALLPLLPSLAQLVAVIVTALVPVLRVLINVFVWLATGVIGGIVLPAIRFLVSVATFAINGIRVVISGLVIGFQALGTAAMWLWHNVLAPAFTTIATIARIMAAIILFVVIAPMVLAFNHLKSVVLAVWHGVFVPAWHGISAAVSYAWTNVIRPTFQAIVRFLDATLGPVIRWLWHNVVGPAWNGIKSVISTVWNTGIRPVFNAVKTAVGLVAHAFDVAASAIKTAWNKIKGYASAPIRFIVETVYNKGVVGMWNQVMGWLHLGSVVGTLRPYHVPGLAAGGELSAAQPIQPMRTNGPVAIVGEGNPAYPEYVIPTDPKHRGRATALWASAGGDLQMLAGGGILGGLIKGVKGVAGKILNLGKDAVNLLTSPKSVWDKLAAPILDKVKGLGTSDWGKAAAAVPPKMLNTLWTSAAKQIIEAFASAFGGNAGAIINAARGELGNGEQPPGSNNTKYGRWFGVNPAPWCAMFVDYVANKAGVADLIPHTASAPGMARAFGSRYHSGGSGIQPGDVPFFSNGGGISHVGLVEKVNGSSVGTIEGNHSSVVQRVGRTTGQVVGYGRPHYGTRSGGLHAPGGGNSPSSAQTFARGQLAEFHWPASQFSPLLSLWNRESGWRWNARNPSSGAYGIPQSLPGSKMASAGSDWRTNGDTQVIWGLGYIKGRYGSPAGAWAHSQQTGWYDNGGMLQPGLTLAYNATRKPEPVLTSQQWTDISSVARGGDGAGQVSYNIYPQRADFRVRDLEVLQRRHEALARVGRPH